MLTLSFGKSEIMKMSYAHLPFHTPAKRGDRAWKIVDDDTGVTVDSYTPPKPQKPQCMTRYAGSWAQLMAEGRAS